MNRQGLHDPELVEQIARIVWDAGGEHRMDDPRTAARAVLDAITGSGRYALVELPESKPGWYYASEDDDAPDYRVFGADDGDYVVTHWTADGHHVEISHQGEPMLPVKASYARELGAALIAAARHAENTTTEQE